MPIHVTARESSRGTLPRMRRSRIALLCAAALVVVAAPLSAEPSLVIEAPERDSVLRTAPVVAVSAPADVDAVEVQVRSGDHAVTRALDLDEESGRWTAWLNATRVPNGPAVIEARADDAEEWVGHELILDLDPPRPSVTAAVVDGDVVLAWESLEVPDLIGFTVSRAGEGGAPAPVAEVGAAATGWVDARPSPGAYRYVVTAQRPGVDAAVRTAESDVEVVVPETVTVPAPPDPAAPPPVDDPEPVDPKPVADAVVPAPSGGAIPTLPGDDPQAEGDGPAIPNLPPADTPVRSAGGAEPLAAAPVPDAGGASAADATVDGQRDVAAAPRTSTMARGSAPLGFSDPPAPEVAGAELRSSDSPAPAVAGPEPAAPKPGTFPAADRAGGLIVSGGLESSGIAVASGPGFDGEAVRLAGLVLLAGVLFAGGRRRRAVARA